MFQRLIRAIKSMFGGLVSSMENPKLILEQNIRDLNDQIPQMNENIATVKANLIMLQKEVKRNEKQIQDLTAKIKSAIQANRDDIAEGYALQLEKAKETIDHSKDQLAFAEKAYEKALKVKKVFMREKDRKIQEAKEALRASERAEWQSKIADTLEQFEVGGIDQTHDEMISRINEEAAKNEARMEIALDSIDTKTMEIEA
ncbi:MAG: PspA/IM30 family protein, partial [Balneolaceae bacterium]